MIRIPDCLLPDNARLTLQSYQSDIDNQPDYASRVRAAKSDFARFNISSREPIKTIHNTLIALCCGARRCMYCEDSCADEVEHFRPKELYPDACFVWENYLFSCGRCN